MQVHADRRLTIDPTYWKDRPVLVTGATGLVGGWLVRRLLELGAETICLVREWVPHCELVRSGTIERVGVVRGEIGDRERIEAALGEHEIRTVFHLAAQTLVPVANRNPVSTWETNIRGTWSLLEACRRSPTVEGIVLASSDKAYGEAETLPYSEALPLRPLFPYDVSKACAEMIARSYAATFSLPVGITRCGNFFGGGDLNWNRIVPGTIRAALRGRRPVIRSDGKALRDYLYVEDGVDAYLLLAQVLTERPEISGEAFNFSYGQPLSVLEIVECILRLIGSDLEPDVQGTASHEIRHQYLDATRARRELGWTPRFDLDSGLERTIRWYRDYLGDLASPEGGEDSSTE